MVEQRIRNAQVVSSSLTSSSFFCAKLTPRFSVGAFLVASVAALTAVFVLVLFVVLLVEIFHRHEQIAEPFGETNPRRQGRPAEQKVQHALPGFALIKFVRAPRAEENRQRRLNQFALNNFGAFLFWEGGKIVIVVVAAAWSRCACEMKTCEIWRKFFRNGV